MMLQIQGSPGQKKQEKVMMMIYIIKRTMTVMMMGHFGERARHSIVRRNPEGEYQISHDTPVNGMRFNIYLVSERNLRDK